MHTLYFLYVYIMSSFYHNGVMYLYHIVYDKNYAQFANSLENVNICDSTIVSRDLEYNALSSLQESGYYGVFVSNVEMTIIYSFVIIDIKCFTTKDKLPTDMQINKCVEITLFCSNLSTRVNKLASKLLTNVIYKFIPTIKPTCEYVVLSVALKDKARLISFYKQFGFHTIPNDENIMILRIMNGGKGLNNRKRLNNGKRVNKSKKSNKKRIRKTRSTKVSKRR